MAYLSNTRNSGTMKRLLPLLGILALLGSSCQKEQVDLIIYNANIYTVNEDTPKACCLAVRDGRIVEVTEKATLFDRYEGLEMFDAKGATLLPGLIDAHCHFVGLGQNEFIADLVGTASMDDVLHKVRQFDSIYGPQVIRGRGWDQNDWEVSEFPDNEELSRLYPDRPVVLERVDGHAYLVNKKALEMAGIHSNTRARGGTIVMNDGKPSGVLIDGPMRLVDRVLPEPSREELTQAILRAQDICLENGLTTVNDAGLPREQIELIDSLQQSGDLKIRVYAMAANSPANVNHYLSTGPYRTDRLNVSSFKVYVDGALGSRGATLKEPYSDQDGHYGENVISPAAFVQLAGQIAESDFQMNTHAIGDSANYLVLKTYHELLQDRPDRRWKNEHSQVVDLENDLQYFSENIIPSVQPTHATSDMYWAEDRLGPQRIKGAYAYKTLLDQAGVLPLGTDFPVEQVNPMYTFYAAVARKDLKGYPEGGYRMEEALSREETLKGMTIWPAYSNFEEGEKGSIEPGKWADFTILSADPMQVQESEIPSILTTRVYIAGEMVYTQK